MPSFVVILLVGLAFDGVVPLLILEGFVMAPGLILPVSIVATILIGGIVAWCIARKGYLKDDNGITARSSSQGTSSSAWPCHSGRCHKR